MKEYPNLTRPLTVGNLTLKNRMLSSPTSMAELGPNEHYSDDNIEYYKLRAAGGAALVTIGDVIVDLDTGRSHPQQAGINDPGSWPYFIKLVDAIHSHGAAASVELDHGGALCAPDMIGGKNAIGPSGYVDAWGDTVDEMTEEQIEQIAEAFGMAAGRAKKLGFDMVMLHSGHGWLLHQFISEMTNHRKDQYGGSLENRMRFPLLVVEKIRAAVGRGFPIEVRISGSERCEGGFDLATGIEVAKMYDGKVDLIHVSVGTQQDEYSCVLMHPGAFQKDMENASYAAEIRKHVKTPVVSVGAFNMPDDMERFLAEGGADAIAMGRALVADPFLPHKVINGTPEKITPCIRCNECESGLIENRTLRCSVNPIIGRERDYFHPLPQTRRRRVLIVGGGPGGMQAALEAHKRGHEVILCDERPVLGGALKYADCGAYFKKPMLRYKESQAEKVMALPIDIRLNTRVDKALVEQIAPDVLILAVGARPFLLPVPGADGSNVVFGADLEADTPIGERVVVIGGGFVGCEEAVYLADKGHHVTILEMLPMLASECGKMHRLGLMHEIEGSDRIECATGMRCTRITGEGVYAADAEGKEVFYPCQTVVMAAGLRARTDVVDELRTLCRDVYVIGDAQKAQKVMHAVRGGYDAVVDMGM